MTGQPVLVAQPARRRSSGRCARAPPRTPRRRCIRTNRSAPLRRRRGRRRIARRPCASRAPLLLAVAEVEHGEERLLRDLDSADLLHAPLALLLLLEQLALAGDVAAVALRDHVLALRLHRLAR